MRDCNFMPECGFYHDKLNNMPPVAEFMKMEYCHKHPYLCARQVHCNALGLNNVPGDLMPNETGKVKYLIDAASSPA